MKGPRRNGWRMQAACAGVRLALELALLCLCGSFALAEDPPILVWSVTWGGVGDDNATGVGADAYGNAYVTGWIQVSGGPKVQTTKVDQYGVIDWSVTIGSSGLSWGVATDALGNSVVAASWGGHWHPVKYDSSGRVLWTQTHGGMAVDYATGVGLDDSGSVYVGGYVYSMSSSNTDVNMVKYSPDGVRLWVASYNSGYWDLTKSAAAFPAGGAVISEYAGTGTAYIGGYLVAFSAGGQFDWSLTTTGNLSSNGIACDPAGNVVANPVSHLDKYTRSGTVLWDALQGWFEALATDRHASIYGATEGLGGTWVVEKFTPGGTLLWTASVDGKGGIVKGLAVNPAGAIFLCGYFSNGTDNDSMLVKLQQQLPPTPPVVPPPFYEGPVRVFPNPYNPAVAVRGTVKFEGVPQGGTLRIYTSSGQKVWSTVSTGGGVIEWEGRNSGGSRVAPGVYWWIVESQGTKQRGKVVVE